MDDQDYDWLNRWTWRAVRYHKAYYAHGVLTTARGTAHRKMHRMVAHTPANMICHHRNRNSLDNRRANLINMTREEHNLLHRNNTLLIQFDPTHKIAATPTSSL